MMRPPRHLTEQLWLDQVATAVARGGELRRQWREIARVMDPEALPQRAADRGLRVEVSGQHIILRAVPR